jgi:hypothetical protein
MKHEKRDFGILKSGRTCEQFEYFRHDDSAAGAHTVAACSHLLKLGSGEALVAISGRGHLGL